MQVQQHRMYREDEEERYEGSKEDDKVHLHLSLAKNELNIGLKELEGKKNNFCQGFFNFAEKEKN